MKKAKRKQRKKRSRQAAIGLITSLITLAAAVLNPIKEVISLLRDLR